MTAGTARQRKLWALARHSGQPARITPTEFEAVAAVVRSHRAAGMSIRQIADAAGITTTPVGRLINGGDSRGPAKSILRSSYTRLMRVEFVPPTGGRRTGAVTDITGVRRRLQALCAAGYTQRFIANRVGLDQRAIHKWVDSNASDARVFVLAQTAGEVRRLYALFADRPAEDSGIAPFVVARARSASARKGWAPPGCWDDDTIDDPDAFPEWTGCCGSRRGYSIHWREKILVCEPCRLAYAEARRVERNRTSTVKEGTDAETLVA